MRFAGSKGHFTITVYKSVWPGSSGPQYKFVTVMAGVATLEQTHLSAVDVVSIPSSSGNLRDGVDGGKVLSRDIFGGRSGSHTTVKMLYADIAYPCILDRPESNECIGMVLVAAVFAYAPIALFNRLIIDAHAVQILYATLCEAFVIPVFIDGSSTELLLQSVRQRDIQCDFVFFTDTIFRSNVRSLLPGFHWIVPFMSVSFPSRRKRSKASHVVSPLRGRGAMESMPMV